MKPSASCPRLHFVRKTVLDNVRPVKFATNTCILLILVVFVGFSLVCPQIVPARDLSTAQDLPGWINQETQAAVEYLLANISPKKHPEGCVQASPGAVQASPDKAYYYHWVRDAGLVMMTVTGLYRRSTDPQEKAHYLQMMRDYVRFARKNQLTPNLSGDRGLAEPKFNMNGGAFNEGWGRPQDDGPAIRVISLAGFARDLTSSQKPEDQQLLGEMKEIVRDDLQYLVQYWKATSHDLWEEVSGHHFHTRMVQRRAFLEGSKLLAPSDPLATESQKAGTALDVEIRKHWNPDKRILEVTLDRDGGLDYKSSGLDTGVMLGVLQGSMDEGIFSPSDDQVLATAESIQQKFREIYAINQNPSIPGVAIGRYPEDRYRGSGSECPLGGNPWVLTTLAFAELCYRVCDDLQAKKELEINPINVRFYQLVMKGTPQEAEISAEKKIRAQDELFAAILSGLLRTGDAFVARVKYHSKPDGSLNEQCNRENGYMCSVEHLTWNYAAFLETIWARDRATKSRTAQVIPLFGALAPIRQLKGSEVGGPPQTTAPYAARRAAGF